VARERVPLFLLRRRLRAAYEDAKHEFRMAKSYLTYDGLADADAWLCFELAHQNLRAAESDYLDTVLDPAH